MSKEDIRKYGLELGADAVGFAAIEDYRSERSPDPQTVLPGAKSMVVLGYRETDGSLESGNPQIQMGARMGLMEFALKNNYLMTRFLEDRYGVKAAPVAISYPLNMGSATGEVSLRHAAVAAGLGIFGRHNLVIHQKFGTRILFTASLTNLPLPSDPPVKDKLCTQCGICVETCPVRALDEEGKTDVMRCRENSQPYGISALIRYLNQFIGTSPEEQKNHLKDPLLRSLYQAQGLKQQYLNQFIGTSSEEQKNYLKDPPLLSLYQAQGLKQQYTCYKCMTVCPAGHRREK
jgi:ferredoxin